MLKNGVYIYIYIHNHSVFFDVTLELSILSTVLHLTTLLINHQKFARNYIKMLSALFGSTNMKNQFGKLSLLEVVHIQNDAALLRSEET